MVKINAVDGVVTVNIRLNPRFNKSSTEFPTAQGCDARGDATKYNCRAHKIS